MPQSDYVTLVSASGKVVHLNLAGLASERTLTPPTTDGAISTGTSTSGGGNFGQATVPFASFKTEDSVAVTGQAALTSGSRITASLLADTDEVLAQDWQAPFITNVIPGIGFTVNLRPARGTFRGAVKLAWNWG